MRQSLDYNDPYKGRATVLNVLTRTSNRPNRFRRCRESVLAQKTRLKVRHFVSIDRPCTYAEADVIVPATGRIEPPIPKEHANHREAPYNLYVNDLLASVKGGWVITLDDDDEFTHERAVAALEPYLTDRDRLVVCRFEMGIGNDKRVVMPRQHGRELAINDVPCTCAVFHSSHKESALWHGKYSGDFYAIENLAKHLEVVWVDEVVARTQRGPGFGRVKQEQYRPWVSCKTEPPTKKELFLSIIIPVLNQSRYTASILEQIEATVHIPHEVIVVDNGSTDDTQDILAQSDVTVIRNEQNVGVSAAWNQGCAKAKSTHIAVLNNDLLLPDMWAETLLAHEVDAICPSYEQGRHPRRDFVEHNQKIRSLPMKTQKAGEPGKFPHGFSGFIFLLSREAWERTGPFDTDTGFGYYWYGDNDYTRRLTGMGFHTYQSTNVLIHHYGSQTINLMPDFIRKREQERILYEEKWRHEGS